MHFCQDELMAVLTAFPVVRGLWLWIKVRASMILPVLIRFFS